MIFPIALLLAALEGFVALSYEILWYRTFSFAGSGAASVFGLLLAFYLFGLANGAQRARQYCEESTGSEVADRAATQRTRRALLGFMGASAVAAFLVIPLTARLAGLTSWLWSLGLVALAATLFGAVLPLLAHLAIRADRQAGRKVSQIYLANIVGSALGSLLTGFFLLNIAALKTLSVVLLAVSALAVALAALAGGAAGLGRRTLIAASAIFVVLLGINGSLFHHLYERLLFQRDYDSRNDFTHVVENRHGVVNVDRKGRVFGSGSYDGVINLGLADDRNLVVRAYAVGALHPRPRRVLMIGLATGAWAQAVLALAGVESLTVVEINPGYLEIIPHFPDVAGLLQDPRVTIAIDDGRRWLQRHRGERYDVVVMNTTWHWKSHLTNLLSREFMEIVRSHLLEGGLFLFNTTGSDDAQRTAALTFPHAMRVLNCMAVSDSPFEFDAERWERILRTTRAAGRPVLNLGSPRDRAAYERLKRLPSSLQRPPVGPGLESRASVLGRTAGADVITDDNMRSEWRQGLLVPSTRE